LLFFFSFQACLILFLAALPLLALQMLIFQLGVFTFMLNGHVLLCI